MIIMGTGMPSPEVLATDTDTRGGDDKKDLEDAAAAAEEEKEEVVEAADGNENLAFAEEEAYASNTTQQKKWESDEGRVLSFWDVFMLQSTYSTAGMIVITPYIFGQWGYVLGPILYALWMLLVYGMACFVCNVMQQSQNEIKHMGDVGFELSGRWGRIIFNTVYMISMISFLPVALETIVISLQAIFGTSFITGKGCVGYWKLITAFALLIFLQNVKRWKGAAWISYVSVILLAIKSFVLIPWGLVAGQETYETSPFNLGPAKPLLSPEVRVAYTYVSYLITVSFLVPPLDLFRTFILLSTANLDCLARWSVRLHFICDFNSSRNCSACQESQRIQQSYGICTHLHVYPLFGSRRLQRPTMGLECAIPP
jgi:hypothetical protein